MKLNHNALAAAALAGLFAAGTAVSVSASPDKGTFVSEEKEKCKGKDKCEGKEKCEGKDKKELVSSVTAEGEKEKCSGKDKCEGKDKDKKKEGTIL